MSLHDTVADDLAIRALDAVEATGDEGLVKKMADAIANSSPTMQEAFLTAVRIRRAERLALKVLAAATAKAQTAKA